MDDQLLKWLTFAVMIIIQVVAAVAILSKVKYITEEHSREIDRLRDWRHDFGQKEGVYDGYYARIAENSERMDKMDGRIDRLETRVGKVERHAGDR